MKQRLACYLTVAVVLLGILAIPSALAGQEENASKPTKSKQEAVPKGGPAPRTQTATPISRESGFRALRAVSRITRRSESNLTLR